MAGKIDKYAGIFREADATGTNTGDETNATIVTKLGNSLANKNLLINPNFSVNQRVYVSGTATTGSNQFTFDRWFIPTTGQSLTFSTVEGLRTITAPASGICQVIEGTFVLSGNYVLNWDGTATGYVNGNQVTKGTPVSLTGGSNITIKFANGTVSKPQFEKGSYATEFEVRPIGIELSLCQRYFEKSYAQETAIGTATVVGAKMGAVSTASDFYDGGYIKFCTTKRANPTVTLYNTNNGTASQITLYPSNNVSANSMDISTGGFRGGSSANAMSAGAWGMFQWVASIELTT